MAIASLSKIAVRLTFRSSRLGGPKAHGLQHGNKLLAAWPQISRAPALVRGTTCPPEGENGVAARHMCAARHSTQRSALVQRLERGESEPVADGVVEGQNVGSVRGRPPSAPRIAARSSTYAGQFAAVQEARAAAGALELESC